MAIGPSSMSVSLANTSIVVAGIILGDGRRIVDRDRRIVDTGHRHLTVAVEPPGVRV